MEYEFILTGITPLLMHADDVILADELSGWRGSPDNGAVSVKGDDRSPAWTWQTYLYHDGKHLAIPQENLMASIRNAAAKIKLKGKGNATFKSLSQSGMLMTSDFCHFDVEGRQIPIADIHGFRDQPFSQHVARCRDLGFDLLVKRAKVDQRKHVRVRAKFDVWTVSGQFAVTEPAITPEVVDQMFDIAGRLSGLGDWRPSAPKSPGPYGMFTHELKPVKASRKAS